MSMNDDQPVFEVVGEPPQDDGVDEEFLGEDNDDHAVIEYDGDEDETVVI